MRVGLFTDTFPPDINGVANSTYILKNELQKHGHSVFVVCTKPGAGFAEWNEDHDVLRLAGIEVKQLYGYALTTPFHYNALKMIKELNLDLIHVQTEFGVGIFAQICAKQNSIPLVATYHTTYEDYTHYVNPIGSKFVEGKAKQIVALLTKMFDDHAIELISPSSKTKELLEKYNVDSEISIIPTGLNLERFDPNLKCREKVRTIRTEYGFDEKDVVVIYVGRIAEEKALDIVIRGFIKAKQNNTDVKLLIVGKGPGSEELEKLVRNSDAEDFIRFTGAKPQEEIPDYYHAADAFVSASLSETQGMTFIEALASGLPLFARKDEVLNDLLIEGKTGWFFSDETDLAEKLEYFVNTNNKDSISRAAVEQVKPLSSEIFYQKVMDVYGRAIAKYHNTPVVDSVKTKNNDIIINFTNSETRSIKMSVDTYYEMRISVGDRISETEIKRLKNKEVENLIYQKAIHRLSVKDRSAMEMNNWLKTQDCTIEQVHNVLFMLKAKGYLDDERFCDEYIASRKRALIGDELIYHELIGKGISENMIQNKLAAYPVDDESNALLLAQKLKNSFQGESLKMQQYKLTRKLITKGYTSTIAKRAVDALSFEKNEVYEQKALLKYAQKAKSRYSRKYQGNELKNAVFRYCYGKGFSSDEINELLNDMEWNHD